MSRMHKCSANPAHDLVGVFPKYCSECGAAVISNTCECGNLLTGDQKFCERCGHLCDTRDKPKVDAVSA